MGKEYCWGVRRFGRGCIPLWPVFVEPGETIEHATAREVFEEVEPDRQYSHSIPSHGRFFIADAGLYATALTSEYQ